ncbi:phosphatase PAP2 family protein [Dictyobacter formicarum]|uniref:Phosphatidic acid phosphatase type 2/haloperoxidase domain-containing protein n=1 Tax=Dictyobacter formicarum TaxID=2778368 RepID=A0ABQ3VBN8_9CHLR|nr:phosphatase PAP2 family protein [Dictyobacter formicarum]GHO83537.1 hypothetical protein KSZ_15430 [Dictyobacter formicarum]
MSFVSFMQENYHLFVELNEHAGVVPWFDTLMIFCANNLIFCWPILMLMAWGLPANWRRRALSPASEVLIQERRSAVLWTAIACLVAYAINLTVEQFINEPRPFVSHHVHLLVAHAADGSFPSDHTAWSFAVVGMLALSLFSWLKLAPASNLTGKGRILGLTPKFFAVLLLVALAMACIIGIARVFVGVHYPGDIVGGAVSGLCASALVTALRRWLHNPTERVLSFVQRIRLA